MKVTRDVILDLLPLYFAGQVSADTKKLVDEFLQTDPDFASMSQRFDAVLKEHGSVPEPAASERHAFERTRMLLRYRNQTIGLAIAFSLMSCAFVFRDGHVEWILLRDKPPVGIAWALTGIVCWVAAYVIGRRATRASATAGDHQDDVP
jgi:hypothetical protein